MNTQPVTPTRKKVKNIPRDRPKYPALRAIMRDVDRFMVSWKENASLGIDPEDAQVAEFIKRIVEWGQSNDN